MRQREGCLDSFSSLPANRVSTGRSREDSAERQAVNDDEPGLRRWVVERLNDGAQQDNVIVRNVDHGLDVRLWRERGVGPLAGTGRSRD